MLWTYPLLRRAVIATLVLSAVGGWTAALRAQDADHPRLGRYKIFINESLQGYLRLKEGGVYEVYWHPGRELRSRGTYRYDAAAKRIVWLSGLNHAMGRGGSHYRKGADHTILMSSSAHAIAEGE